MKLMMLMGMRDYCTLFGSGGYNAFEVGDDGERWEVNEARDTDRRNGRREDC
jgi:hypothetical protein